MEYRGFKIEQKRDFGEYGYLIPGKGLVKTGYVITDGRCNVMPGASWAITPSVARKMIDAYIAAGGLDGKKERGLTVIDTEKFYRLCRA